MLFKPKNPGDVARGNGRKSSSAHQKWATRRI
jgi:hypothetical protein